MKMRWNSSLSRRPTWTTAGPADASTKTFTPTSLTRKLDAPVVNLTAVLLTPLTHGRLTLLVPQMSLQYLNLHKVTLSMPTVTRVLLLRLTQCWLLVKRDLPTLTTPMERIVVLSPSAATQLSLSNVTAGTMSPPVPSRPGMQPASSTRNP